MTVTLAAALALAMGVVFLVGGLVRLGWIVNFISKAVMAGFITGMAIQIIVGQLGRGPYPVAASVAAYEQHRRLHEPLRGGMTAATITRPATPRTADPTCAPVRRALQVSNG